MSGPVILGTNVVNASSTTGAITVGSAVPAGSLVFGALAWSQDITSIPTVSGVSDGRGNTYSAADIAAGTANTTVSVTLLSSVISTALQTSDTITVTIGAARTRWCLEFNASPDERLVSPLDQTAPNHNPGSSASLTTTASGAIAQPYELQVAVFGFGAGSSSVCTLPTGWSGGSQTTTTAGSANRSLKVGWRYLADPAKGAQTGTATLDIAATYAACLATYRSWIPAGKLAAPTSAVQRAGAW